MNRLRRAYLDIDPGIEPYLMAGHADDLAGVARTYTMGPHRNATQLLASASLFITSVTALVAGGWVGILASPAGTPAAVAIGVLGGLAYVGAFLYAGYRLYGRYERQEGNVRFPTRGPAGDQSANPPARPSPS